MGEWSRKIGEVGEDILKEFFTKIGWADSQQGVSINCIKPQKHGSNGKDRKTHGIDFLFSYPSPLIDGVLDNLVISSKYIADKYPSSPSTKFKDFFTDLAQTVECFKGSHQRQEINCTFTGVDRAIDIGVLFWLSNSKDSDDEILAKIANCRIDDSLTFDTIYVVDNKRIAFLYDTLTYIENQYPKAEISFFYPDTGRNVNPLILKNSGKILPVQYINTSVLPLRLDTETGTLLVLSVIDEFEKDSLKRLMGLAQKLTSNFAAQTVILFSDFDSLVHGNIVQSTKFLFHDKKFTETVRIMSYRDDFRRLKDAR